MSIKKVMIISAMPHNKIGGVETYNRKLIEIFKKLNFEIDEYVIKPIKKIENQGQVSNSLETHINYVGGRSYFYPLKAKKMIEKNIDSYDIVVNASKLFTKRICSHRGHILIQHTPYEDYVPSSLFQKIKWFFDRVFLGLGIKGDVFEVSNKSVFYSEYTNVKSYKGSYNIPLTAEIIKHKDYDGGFVWAARLQDSQKGIKNLIKIKKAFNKDTIEVIGSGEDQKIISKEFQKKWLGQMDQKDLREKMIGSKAFILTSNYEGAAYTVTEALCSGLPVVLFNTFRHAQFYDHCDNVFLIKPDDIKDFVSKMNEINSWTASKRISASKNIMKFAMNYLSDDIFKNQWTKIIKEF